MRSRLNVGMLVRLLLSFQNATIFSAVIRSQRIVRFGRAAKSPPPDSLLSARATPRASVGNGRRGIDASRAKLVSEKLQAFYVLGNHKICVDFVFLQEQHRLMTLSLLRRLSCNGLEFLFCSYISLPQDVRPSNCTNYRYQLLLPSAVGSSMYSFQQ